ncbi:MAG: hypothetical protein A3H98_03555 [Bacteroidetes bacterium RIFCSPLOWO2_02_FULL_36_8]|nr:MAG: hypothetical protein A3H98_03555 [Bacteroidetes bacterium RIFCSPLOWO2_02_FULL_36_8]OFY69518.1 MAG: hypothetical protein A3G23_10800 [Bacteroidetes bacterium RIFCSPLOWO2_12_FULL_37_12]
MRLKLILLISLSIGILLSSNAIAQKKEKKSPPKKSSSSGTKPSPTASAYFIGGFSGVTYKGDLSNRHSDWTPEVSAGILKEGSGRVSFMLQFGAGNVIGEDRGYIFAETATPNKFFSTNYYKAWGELVINIWRISSIKLFSSAGLGVMKFTPENEKGEPLIDDLSTRPKEEIYGANMFFFPLSIGTIFYLPNGFAVNLSASYIFNGNDYIDNVGEWGATAGKDKLITVSFKILVPPGK